MKIKTYSTGNANVSEILLWTGFNNLEKETETETESQKRKQINICLFIASDESLMIAQFNET